ncbi:hypothetical protein [Acetobacter sp. AC2005]|uniref:hypothetical protein n=1 Tax=Acetobacter sp. AC2005 TaxID=3134142 RepID=UPI0038D1B47E
MAREEVRTVCPYCGVGCGIILEVENDRIAKVRGDTAHPANGGRLCTKGSSCDKPLLSDQRLHQALIRPQRGNLTEGLYIGLDYEKVCFVEKKFP